MAAGPNMQQRADWSVEEDPEDAGLTPEELAKRDLAARAALLSAPAVPGRRVQYNDPSAKRAGSVLDTSPSGLWKGPRTSKDKKRNSA